MGAGDCIIYEGIRSDFIMPQGRGQTRSLLNRPFVGGRLGPILREGILQRSRLQAAQFPDFLQPLQGAVQTPPAGGHEVLVIVTGPFDLLPQVFQPFQELLPLLAEGPEERQQFLGGLLQGEVVHCRSPSSIMPGSCSWMKE